jgi:hypothetical protein
LWSCVGNEQLTLESQRPYCLRRRIVDVNGTLYGTTMKGGANCGKGYSWGTVYSISTACAFHR